MQTAGSYTVTQTANRGDNSSIIRSDGGTSIVTQTASLSSDNESTIIQEGNNTANVTQTMASLGGDNTSTIEQTLTGGGSTQNRATLVQTANYGPNVSHITQTGSGNVANVYQH